MSISLFDLKTSTIDLAASDKWYGEDDYAISKDGKVCVQFHGDHMKIVKFC